MKTLIAKCIFLLGFIVGSQASAAGLGELDPSFGNGGMETAAFNLAGDLPGGLKHDIAWAMAKSPDGRIYQAGSLDNGGGTFKLGLARFSQNGAIDFTFGVGGKVTYQHPGLTSMLVLDAVFHPVTGRLVVTGAAMRTGSPDVGMLTCRFLPNGTIDTTFAVTGPDPLPGCRFIKIGEHAVAKSVVIQPNGRIVIAGNIVVNGVERAVIARLLPNGALDDGLYGVEFGDKGVKIPFPAAPKGNSFEDLALTSDGRIVAVGTSEQAGSYAYLIARFDNYGTLDQSLKGTGSTVVQFDDGGANQDRARAVHVFDDNSMLVLGSVDYANGARPGLVRLKPDGEPDNTFGSNLPLDGKSIFDLCNNCDIYTSDLKVAPNGWIYVGGGYSNIGMFAARFNSGGLPDLSWNKNQGFTIVDFGNQPPDTAFRIDLQGSRLVLSGATDTGLAAGLNYAIARLDNGSAQIFNVTPKVAPPGGGTISPIAVQPVVHSGNVAFTVTPNANHIIKEVTGCGGALIGNIYTTGPVTDHCTVTAYFSNSIELNYYAGEGGWLQGNVQHIKQTVPYGGSGTPVEAFAAEGFQFKRWSDGNINKQRIDVNVTQSKGVEAEFEVRTYKVALVPTPAQGGSASPVDGQLVAHGSKAQFTITPNPGYGVVGVSDCGSQGTLIGDTYLSVPVTDNCVAPVNFVKSDAEYKLTYRAGQHCVIIDADPFGMVEQVVASGYDGDTVKVTGHPGYVFLKWTDGSTDAIRKDTNVFNHLDVTAECVAENSLIHTVTPVSGYGGGLSPVESVPVADGYTTKFDVLPSEGFAIESVSGCGTGKLEGNVYTTGKVTTDCEVTATFVASNAEYTLQYGVAEGGQLEGNALQIVKSGGWGKPVKAVPHPSYVFLQWSDGVTDNPRQDKHVVANVNVTAIFADASALTVTPFAGLGGEIAPDLIQVVKEGSVLEFIVTPEVGHAISSVTGCKGTLDGKVYTTGQITESCMVQAWFEPTDEAYLLTYTAGPNGYLNNNEQVVETSTPSGGDGPLVTATASNGYIFLQWINDGVDQNPRQDTGVIADVDVVAQFVPEDSLIVTPIVEGIGGTFEPSLKQVVEKGGLAQFELLPKPGFKIESVGGTCGGELVGKVYTTLPVTQSCNVKASFAPTSEYFDLMYEAVLNGTVNGEIAIIESVIAGGTGPEVLAEPEQPGYIFTHWSDGSQANPRTDANIIEKLHVYAYFAAEGSIVVTPKAGLGGEIEPWLPQVVEPGDSVQFEIKPGPGFAIESVAGTCTGSLQGKIYTTNPVTEHCTVEANFKPSDEMFSLTYTAGPNGKVNDQDVVSDPHVISGGTGPEVFAKASDGYFFVQWSDGVTDNPRTDANIIENIDVTAIFAANGSLIVTPVVIGGVGGSLSPEGIQVVAPGAIVEFTLKPEPGYAIDYTQSDCGGMRVGNIYTTAPIAANCAVEVAFVASDEKFTLTYTAGENGKVNGEDVFVAQNVIAGGSGPEVLAGADTGYFFVTWSDGSTENPRTDANIVGNVDVTAIFAPEGWLVVTPSVIGFNGFITPDVPQAVAPGGNAVFTVSPYEGFGIGEIQGTCGGSLQGKVYTTNPVTENCTVIATFIPSDATYHLIYGTDGNGLVNGEAFLEIEVPSGGTGPLVEAQPSDGFVFAQWSDGVTDSIRTDANVISGLDVVAMFVPTGSVIVTPIVNGSGSVSPDGPQAVPVGGTIQFTLKPEEGFGIETVAGTCGGSLAGNLYTTNPVEQSCTVEVTFAESDDQFVLTYSPGPGGDVLGQLVQVVPSGGTGEAVTAQPDNGYIFVKWSDGWTEVERKDANVVADIMVTAEFAEEGSQIWTVTPTWEGGGSLWPNEAFPVVDGDNAVLTIKPNLGFGIGSVTGCDGQVIGNQYVTAPVTADCEVHAVFVPSDELFTLNYAAGINGLVNGAQQVQFVDIPSGGQGELVEAQPANDHFFVAWSDGKLDGSRLDANVAADIDVTANFALNGTPVYIVSPTWSQGGALSPPNDLPVAEGASAQFTVVPQQGHALVGVSGTCGGSLVGNLYTTNPVTGDCTVDAEFAPSNEVFTLTYIAGPNGKINVNLPMLVQNVQAGGDGPLVEATPAGGHMFLTWSDGNTDNPRQDLNVAGDIEVTAQFAPIGAQTWKVTSLIANGGGTVAPLGDIDVVNNGTTQFAITPNDGYVIGPIGGTCGGSLAGNVYTTNPVTGDCTVEVEFVAGEGMFTLTYIAGPNGDVNGQQVFVQNNVPAGGAGPEVHANAEGGYMFLTWSDGNTDNPRQDMNVSGNIEVTAQFVLIGAQTWTVTSSAGAGGSISPLGDIDVVDGGTVPFTITPEDGYAIDSIGGTCLGTLVGNVFTTNPISGDCTVDVTFVYDRIFYNGFGFGDEYE